MATIQVQKTNEQDRNNKSRQTFRITLPVTQDQLDTLPVLGKMFAKGHTKRFLIRQAKGSIRDFINRHQSTIYGQNLSAHLDRLWNNKKRKQKRATPGIVKVIELELKLTPNQIRAIDLLAEVCEATPSEFIAEFIRDSIRGLMTVLIDCGAKGQTRKFAATAYKIWGGDEQHYLNFAEAQRFILPFFFT